MRDLADLVSRLEARSVSRPVLFSSVTQIRFGDALVFCLFEKAQWQLDLDGRPRIGFKCVGGKKEAGESFLECVKHECAEEMGQVPLFMDATDTYYLSPTGLRRVRLKENIRPFLILEESLPEPGPGGVRFSTFYLSKAVQEPAPCGEIPALVTVPIHVLFQMSWSEKGIEIPLQALIQAGSRIRERTKVPRDAILYTPPIPRAPDYRAVLMKTLSHPGLAGQENTPRGCALLS